MAHELVTSSDPTINMILENTIKSFNQRQYKEAVRYSAEGLAMANGEDEAFWMGLNEACEAYELLGGKQNKIFQKTPLNAGRGEGRGWI